MIRRRLGVMVVLILLVPLLVSCGRISLVFEVDNPRALLDQPVRIRVLSAPVNATVTVEATGTDITDRTWRASASFRADNTGAVDLTTSAPLTGSYRGVDGMGLFWSVDPDGGDGDRESFIPKLVDNGRSYEIRLSASAAGSQPATTTVRRDLIANGVSERELTLAADGMVGRLLTPPDGSPRRVGVLVFGGSEGGLGLLATARLLASRGYPALALGYFALPGLPQTLREIPLEYFASAARLLGQQPSVDGPSVAVIGYSRGTEAAMLLADLVPDAVRAVVLYAPAYHVNIALDNSQVAWTRAGQPVPLGPLPVARVTAPVLAVAGGADEVWQSGPSATALRGSLDKAHPDQRHDVLLYDDAGHGVGLYPYTQSRTHLTHPVTKAPISFGGSRAADAAARADGYPKMLAFLAAA